MQIHFAAKRGDIEAVQRQVSRRIPIDSRDESDGKTPLMFAAESKHAGVSMLKSSSGTGRMSTLQAHRLLGFILGVYGDQKIEYPSQLWIIPRDHNANRFQANRG